ncbi:MAG: glycoside hydrolase family 88/105 protein [Lachnospiraceae bacterium]|jgi:unsaturated rhamnogalacturonyl hydrolase
MSEKIEREEQRTDSRTPLDYAEQSVKTMMGKFAAADLPPKGHFHYHQGVFLSGVLNTWRLSGRQEYYDYAKAWVDSVVTEDGRIPNHDPGQLDDIQPGILLYPILDQTKDERYRKALDVLAGDLEKFPKNPIGGFWHKDTCPDQMWLDGLYMGGPVMAEYGYRFSRPDFIDETAKQVKLMFAHTRDSRTGLLYHAWDYSRKAPWADPETGLSPEFWGRSIGWVPVAVLDDLEFMDGRGDREELEGLAADLLKAVVKYQSEDGRWYQVVDKGDQPGNWLENSCSCLFAAALFKAVRKGILPEEYADNAWKAYRGVIRSLSFDGDRLLVGNVCIGTGVGDYQHYCDRPVSVNDLHGVGAFLLMCAEAERVRRLSGGEPEKH